MIKNFLLSGLVGAFCIAGAGVSWADSNNSEGSHLQIINSELDQIEAYLNYQTPQSKIVPVPPITVNMPVRSVAQPAVEAPAVSYSSPDFKKNEVELALESFSSHFQEKGLPEKGSMLGYDVKYEHHFSTATKMPISMVGLQGQWAWGKFKQPVDGGFSGIKDNTLDIRAIAGKDFHPMTHVRTTAYLGYGFRYLKDNSTNLSDTIGVYMVNGYARVSHYSYMPIGMDFIYQTSPRYSWESNLEYDYLLDGWQVNKIGVVPGYNTLTVAQRNGFGLRASVRFNWYFRYGTLFAEWFWRYWNIAQSQSKPDPTDNTLPVLYEPKNTTNEFGLRLGVDI